MPSEIVFLIGQMGMGGSEKQLLLLSRELAKTRKLSVISFCPPCMDFWTKQFSTISVPFFKVPRDENRLSRLLKLMKILRDEKPKIIFSFSFYTNFYAVLASIFTGVPVTIGSNRASFAYYKKQNGSFLASLNNWGLDCMVVNSLSNAMNAPGSPRIISSNSPDFFDQIKIFQKTDVLKRLFRITAPPIFVIKNGIDSNKKLDSNKEKHLQRKRAGIDQRGPVLITMCRLDKNKNVKLILSAHQHLLKDFPRLILLIIGDGPEKEDLIQFCKKGKSLQNVRFSGTVTNPADLIRSSDIACLTSYDEGLSNFLLEASASGLPIVATQAGGNSEVVEDGITGFLVPPNDYYLLAAKIKYLLHHPDTAKKMGMAGFRKVCTEFSVQKMTDDFNLVFNHFESLL